MADAFVTSAAGSLGSSGLKALLTYFSDRFLAVKRNTGGLINIVNSDASAMVAEKGESVNIPIYSATSSSLLTDGNSVTKDDTLGASATVTLNKHRYKAFGFTQIAQALSGNVAAAGLIEQRCADILNDIETDLASVATAGLTTNTVGTYNTAVTEAILLNGISKLDAQKTPYPRYGFLHPSANGWEAFKKISNIVNSQYIGGPTPLSGNPNTHYWNGVNWAMSQAVAKSTNDCDGFVINRDAIVMASRPLPKPMSPGVEAINFVKDGIAFQMLVSFDGTKLADQMVLHVLYGFGAGEEKYGLQVKH